MPALTAETTDYRLEFEAGQRRHWTAGRDPACELFIEDKGVSRFHATVFCVDGRFHVIDHSLNGTHLFRGEEEFRVALASPWAAPAAGNSDVVGFETCRVDPVDFRMAEIPAQSDGKPLDLHRSVTELRIQQIQTRVLQLPGHASHSFTDAGRLKPLLDMVYGEDAEMVAGLARPVAAGNVLLFLGHDRHFFRYVE